MTVWIPPAAERVFPVIRAVARFRGQAALVLGFLIVLAVITVLLATGLWRMNKWAAWVTTAVMMFTIVQDGFGIIGLVKYASLAELVSFGKIPAVLWAMAYVLLLWGAPFVEVLRLIGNSVRRLRKWPSGAGSES